MLTSHFSLHRAPPGSGYSPPSDSDPFKRPGTISGSTDLTCNVSALVGFSESSEPRWWMFLSSSFRPAMLTNLKLDGELDVIHVPLCEARSRRLFPIILLVPRSFWRCVQGSWVFRRPCSCASSIAAGIERSSRDIVCLHPAVLAALGLRRRTRCYLSRLRNERMRGVKIRHEVAQCLPGGRRSGLATKRRFRACAEHQSLADP